MPKALVNGLSIYYESHGSGFPLVLSCVLGGNTTQWAPQIPVFSKRYRLILWDPRGHGNSDTPGRLDQYSMDTFAADLVGLLDHLKVERAYVGGLSMGAAIAVLLTMAHPERVAGLLVFDSTSASGLVLSPEVRASQERNIILAETKGMDEVTEYYVLGHPTFSLAAKSSAETAEHLRKMFLSCSPAGYAHSTRALMHPVLDSDRLKTIEAPTLVMAGAYDPSADACRFIHAKIPGSKLVTIPNAGHLSNVDRPTEFNAAALEFLGQLDGEKDLGVSAS